MQRLVYKQNISELMDEPFSFCCAAFVTKKIEHTKVKEEHEQEQQQQLKRQ